MMMMMMNIVETSVCDKWRSDEKKRPEKKQVIFIMQI